jgi:hypothetical protein
MCTAFLIYKSDPVNELPVHNFIFQHSRWHCPNIKSWNQLLYPRVIEVCRLPFEPRHDFFLHLIIVVETFPSEMFPQMKQQVEIAGRKVRTVRRMVQYIPRSPFALRNRMTARTSHLAGLWVGAAISNTSHSNKAGSTTVKRARLTGKGSKSTAILPQ